MNTTWLKRAVIGGGVALALVGGGAIAFANGQTTAPTSTFQSFLDNVAGKLGIQPAALQTAIQQAEIDQVNQAVASGKLTQAQANVIEGKISSGNLRPFFGEMHGPHHRGMRGGALMNQAATYLGITPQQLRTQLQAGQTLGQIADSTSGKSSAGLQSYLLTQMQTRLEAAVKSGKITADQEAQMLTQAKTKIADLMNRTFKAPTATPSGTSSGA